MGEESEMRIQNNANRESINDVRLELTVREARELAARLERALAKPNPLPRVPLVTLALATSADLAYCA